MHHPYSLPLMASLVLGLTACDPRAVNETLPAVIVPESSLGSDKIEQTGDACYKETYTQPDAAITDKVDILFVVDTSASLVLERSLIASHIDHFIKELPRDTHYRIGVMLAHGKRSKWSGKMYYDGLITPAVFDSKKHSPMWIRLNLSIRLNMVAMDYFADGGEAHFYSLHKALDSANLAKNQKQGMFRSDAALSVIFVSDENELCYDYPAGVTPRKDFDKYQGGSLEELARLENCSVKNSQGNDQKLSAAYLHQRIKEVKGVQPFTISTIMHTSKNYKPVLPRAEDEYGYGFDDIVGLSNGNLVDIRNRNYEEGLERIGRSTASTMTLYQKFVLTYSDINVSSLAVKVDSAPRDDFSYLLAENSVFLENAGAPKSVIEIDYCRIVTGGEDPGGENPENPGEENPENPGEESPEDPGEENPENPDDGEPEDGGDLPGGCTAVDCPDIGL